MRMREKVMKTSWALPRWASSGVAAVMKPQAEADSRMTFSPPILEGQQEDSDGDGGAGQADQKILPRRHVAGGLAIPLRSTLCGGTAAVSPSAEAEGESAGSSLVSVPTSPQSPQWDPRESQVPPPPRRVDLGSPSSLFLGRASPASVPRSPLPCAALRQEQPERPSLGRGRLPVPQVAAHDLCQAVAPEEAAEHNAGLLLVPAEVLAHGDGADGHADAGAVQQARAQEQRPRPCLALGPVGDEAR